MDGKEGGIMLHGLSSCFQADSQAKLHYWKRDHTLKSDRQNRPPAGRNNDVRVVKDFCRGCRSKITIDLLKSRQSINGAYYESNTWSVTVLSLVPSLERRISVMNM